ncbi:hypothetical protein PFISCL1PPCAC_20575, partial [Pristionchus fissidentatus]
MEEDEDEEEEIGDSEEEELMDKDQREQRIKELREENEQRPPRFSRSCGVCYTESPRQRSVFVQCGHTTCSACALQIADGSTLLVCPFCREETDFIKLFETIPHDCICSDIPSPHFSRACGVCFTANPRRRAAFVPCGHIACLSCAHQLA